VSADLGGIRSYIFDSSERGAVSGALAGSFVAFFMYRLALSQRENNMPAYFLLALVIASIYEYKTKRVAEQKSYKPQRRPYSPAGERELRTT
jgi:hypothetical protein